MSEKSSRHDPGATGSADQSVPAPHDAGVKKPHRQLPHRPERLTGRNHVGDAVCQHFQGLVEQLGAELASGGHATLTVGLTSSQRREGVSSMAAGLAVTAALRGLCPVLVIDANLTRPAMDQIFQTNRSPGLVEYLLEGAEADAVRHASAVRGLSVVGVGALPGDPTPVWEALRRVEWLRELGDGYCLVIVDLPALSADGLSASLASQLDGTLLVVEGERSQRAGAEAASRLLAAANAQLRGVVFNKYRRRGPRWLERRSALS